MEENVRGGEALSKTKYVFLKRMLDVLFSFLLLVLLALPMLLIGLCVSISSRGGPLFRQPRIGRGGRTFTCYKFRTMVRDAPPNRPSAVFLDAERYITPIGHFLRKTSLDELPQLWNVLRGDMSLVGPRPLIGEEQEMHRARQERGVYGVRPGMTGLAQIHGRDRLADKEKAALDAKYVESLSFRHDLAIVVKSFGCLFAKEEIK